MTYLSLYHLAFLRPTSGLIGLFFVFYLKNLTFKDISPTCIRRYIREERHAATYASRAGTPIEIVSKVILRHADLTITQRYLGHVSDTEAIRWIENLYG